MKSKLFAAVAVALAVGSGSVAEEDTSNMSIIERYDRFNLWNECGPVSLLVEGMKDDATKIGLTRERTETVVRSKLRAARIFDESADPYVYVNINVNGPAFNISLELKKRVAEAASEISSYAATWNTGGVATHGQDASYILLLMSEFTDIFIDEYLRVNAEAC